MLGLGYTVVQALWMAAAAVVLDRMIGDPRWLPHPVIWIGRLISWLEKQLRRETVHTAEAGVVSRSGEAAAAEQFDPRSDDEGKSASDEAGFMLRIRGIALTAITVMLAFAVTWLLVYIAQRVHPWLGFAVNIWFIASTLAVKGLSDAAMQVYRPLVGGDLPEARTQVGYIVGRDTDRLDEAETSRAAIETVAENIVDAFVSPLLYAVLGGAPLAMLYRAANTLDSMVGYKNAKYLHFGWASARWDDVMNYVPARLTGCLMVAVCWALPGYEAGAGLKAWRSFAGLHPSPNSGIPESVAAGALGIQLGGRNVYSGLVSERARMGWERQPIRAEHIVRTVRLLHGVSVLAAGGLVLCAIAAVYSIG
ncbi:adenosylcobinamide-phosphate synthase CbiB [Paenibacillus turpanensis]|uniref:adenosylcobinamide-phosphate synthase CbiB n=1 Tax=Paenibacillus turpanensis TaxID=2689078 RepID=UPI001409B8FA|nr:adenosylcobinamide-phosphate synthase CbiB [Paenibacillus turpanensis]